MSDEDDQQRRLLEYYGRTQPRVGGFTRPSDILGLALKNDPATTRYGLESARQAYRATGGIQRGQSMSLAGAPYLQMFQYVPDSETEDYIDVLPFDGERTYGEQITIGKAAGLGKYDYDTVDSNGITYAYVTKNTRTATNAATGVVTTETITPSYEDESCNRIIGVKVIGGFNPIFEEADYIDLNDGARSWRATNTSETRWTRVTGWTPTPATLSRITITTGTSALKAGMPIRYKTGGATYYYAIISLVNIGYIDIKGPTLSGQTISGIDVGQPEMVVQLDLVVPGLYAVATGNILAGIGKTYCAWHLGPAAIVNFKACNNTAGAGTAVVNVKIGILSVAVTGITPSTTAPGTSSGVITSSSYGLSRDSVIEIAVTTIDATAKNLTVSVAIVLA